MSEGKLSLPVARSTGETSRTDTWWVQPLLVFLGFSAFIIYSTWAAFQNDHFTYGNYLSPFYSPVLFDRPTDAAKKEISLAHGTTAEKGFTRAEEQRRHSFFQEPGWFPAWIPFSAALLILPFPGLFRFTCYYYRGAYYKAFWADPINCAVGEPRKSYWGENWLPLILHNLHRYALYIALIFIVILAWDAIQGFIVVNPDGSRRFGIGVGSFVLLLNVFLLGSYTLGCHSMRHLIGGYQDELSKSELQKTCYDCVSNLNRRHGMWAWFSLFWVGFSDLYVRLCSMGIWTDFRIL